jgi:hemoglobin
MSNAGWRVDPYADAEPEKRDADVGVSQFSENQEETLYDRPGGAYGIAGAVDIPTEQLFENDTANQNPVTAEFHEEHDPAGFNYLVTRGPSSTRAGRRCTPGGGCPAPTRS